MCLTKADIFKNIWCKNTVLVTSELIFKAVELLTWRQSTVPKPQTDITTTTQAVLSGEDYIVKSFMICTLHQTVFEKSKSKRDSAGHVERIGERCIQSSGGET
jgi:hypothetical protein